MASPGESESGNGSNSGGSLRVINPVAEVSASVHEESLRATTEKNPSKFATVDLHTAYELHGARCFVGESENIDGTKKGTYGVVVRSNGDITGVYNGNGYGAIQPAMFKAIESGGNRLDAYAVDLSDGQPGALAKTYHQYGFTPVARVAFNPEYAAPGMKPQDIVVYRHNGDSAETVAANYGKYAPPTREQYDRLPVMDYDAAIKYRDDLMREGEK
jgi:hypothetical protein